MELRHGQKERETEVQEKNNLVVDNRGDKRG